METVWFILLHKQKDFTPEVIEKHIEHLKRIQSEGRLVLCGPFRDWPGGMVVVKAENRQAALLDALADPFVREGFETFEIHELEVSMPEEEK